MASSCTNFPVCANRCQKLLEIPLRKEWIFYFRIMPLKTTLILLLLVLTAIQQFVLGQTAKDLMHRDGFLVYKDTTILSSDSTILKKDRIVILRETDSFTLFTSYVIFQDNLKKFIKEYGVDWDKDLLGKLQKRQERIIWASKVANTPLAVSRVDFRTAELLQNGKCLVYNKLTKKLARTITIKFYRVGKHCIANGRLYYIDGMLILTTEDGIT
jgi:hypothetical protein